MLLLRMSSSLTALSIIFLDSVSTTRHFHYKLKLSASTSAKLPKEGSPTSPRVMDWMPCRIAGTNIRQYAQESLGDAGEGLTIPLLVNNGEGHGGSAAIAGRS
jgi:hypothetical protein